MALVNSFPAVLHEKAPAHPSPLDSNLQSHLLSSAPKGSSTVGSRGLKQVGRLRGGEKKKNKKKKPSQNTKNSMGRAREKLIPFPLLNTRKQVTAVSYSAAGRAA